MVSNVPDYRFPIFRNCGFTAQEYSNGTTQAQIAEDIQTTKSYVNRVIKKPNGVVNNTFVQMMEVLGYDIELHYVKKEV